MLRPLPELFAARVPSMKFLLVDDHPLVRAGIASVLLGFAPELNVLQASDGVEALACMADNPDVVAVLLDLRMAGMAGLATLELLNRHHAAVPVLVISSSEDPQDVRRVLKAGARGYCPKSSSASTLVAALRLVISGVVYVPPFMANAIDPGPTGPDRHILAQSGIGPALTFLGRQHSRAGLCRYLSSL